MLTDHLGDWRGTNAFRLTPSDTPHGAPASAQLSTRVHGLVTELAYTWSHAENGDQAGLLVMTQAEEPPGVVALWCDTFHQSPAAALLHGTYGDGVLTLGYTYAGDWLWTIVVDGSDPARLTMRMDNTVPESAAAQGYPPGTYWAMSAELVQSRE